jgi:hypothetical protein
MKAAGGILLIGAADNGEAAGLRPDLKTLGVKQNIDGRALAHRIPRPRARTHCTGQCNGALR